MFEGFDQRRVAGDGAEIFVRIGGSGPPLLLLHGYPQSHLIWRLVAPRLAERFTVICPDLRGYGASSAPASTGDHAPYSKRAMASDIVNVMTGLGFERFAAAGHDRGGRVLHRMCLDHPRRTTAAALLDIVPTRTLFEATSQALATDYYHWFFLIQKAPLPERMISQDPELYVKTKLARGSAGGLAPFPDEVLSAYVDAFRNPELVHASCEDYRAAATIDLEHDRADATVRIDCPLLVLWGEQAAMHRHFDVAATWASKARGPIAGRALACGHYLPEEAPESTATALASFFAQPAHA